MSDQDVVFKVEQGCPATKQGLSCGCYGACHELIEVVKASDYFKLLGRLEQVEADSRLARNAEALAHAVSASLTHGEDSPLADALKSYLHRHPWSDL